MKKISKRKSVQTEILGIAFLSIFLITSTLGYLSFHFSKNRLIYMLGNSSKGIAVTVANLINVEDLFIFQENIDEIRERLAALASPVYANLYEKTMKGMEEKRLSLITFGAGRDYKKIDVAPKVKDEKPVQPLNLIMEKRAKYAEQLSNVKKANKIEGPVNVYIKNRNRLMLLLSSDAAAPIGALYTIRPEAEEALSNNSSRSTGIYKDKDGTWISAFAPVSSAYPANSLAIVEVDYKIDMYINRLRRELAMIIFVCLIGFIGTGTLSYKLVAVVIARIKELDKAADNLQKEDYNIRVEIKSEDEIGHLAETFEKLRLSIRVKIDELKAALTKEKKAHLESIIALGNAIDFRDPYTRKHLYRVEKYAILIAKALRLPRSEIEKLRYGCYLHDIGKLYIDDLVLKKTKLTSAEVEEIKKHPENGARIVEGIPFLHNVKDIILYHQEHYDGTGYPVGLKGRAIPFLARIVGVADAFDAMTTDRPYQPKMAFKKAMDIIAKESGVQFDPDVCRAFLKYKDSIETIAKKHF